MRLWDGQAGAAGLSGAWQSCKGQLCLQWRQKESFRFIGSGVWHCMLSHSLERCVPSPPAPTLSNRGKTSTSQCWWTERRTFCGAQSWRGEPELPVNALWWTHPVHLGSSDGWMDGIWFEAPFRTQRSLYKNHKNNIMKCKNNPCKWSHKEKAILNRWVLSSN